jgi:hypothetical protein
MSLSFSAWPNLVKTLLALSIVLVSSMVFGIGKKKWDLKGKARLWFLLKHVIVKVRVTDSDTLALARLHYRR